MIITEVVMAQLSCERMKLSIKHMTDKVRVMSGPRRAPADDRRQRDSVRPRERILDAALVEFGEHGYAGARIGAIARRAGVNQQLISYYFDGKEGLHRALIARWRETSAALSRPEAPLGEVVAGFAHVGDQQRHWVRLLVWQALGGEREPDAGEYRRAMVEDLRPRQEAGEIDADLDPAYLQLALFGVALAPTLLAPFAADFTGLDPAGDEFRERYRMLIERLVARLSSR
jgi:TetR/AcrR family transcriptional regulator